MAALPFDEQEFFKSVGVTGAEAEDAGPVPAGLAARTVNVYAVPFVSPLTVQLSAPVVVQALAPGLELTA